MLAPLPRGLRRRLRAHDATARRDHRDSLRPGDRCAALARAAAITVGLATTTLGYLAGMTVFRRRLAVTPMAVPRRGEWVLERLPDDIHEVILVDGGSRDATIEVAKAARPDIIVEPDHGLLKLCTDGFEIETELVVCSARAGLRVAEVPSFELPRRLGGAKPGCAVMPARRAAALAAT